jgi:hypothetical protein
MGKERNEDAAARQVQEILTALKRHPTVLDMLAEKIKSLAPESGLGARRRGRIIDPSDLLELQMHLQVGHDFARRRNAVQLTAEELIRGRITHQPRRKPVFQIDPWTQQRLQTFYRNFRQGEAGRSSADDSTTSDDSGSSNSRSTASDELDEAAQAHKNLTELHRPTFDDDDMSSLRSYETPSTTSRGSHDDNNSLDDEHEHGFDLRGYLEKQRLRDGALEDDENDVRSLLSYEAPPSGHGGGGDGASSDDDSHDSQDEQGVRRHHEKERRRGRDRDRDRDSDSDSDGFLDRPAPSLAVNIGDGATADVGEADDSNWD